MANFSSMSPSEIRIRIFLKLHCIILMLILSPVEAKVRNDLKVYSTLRNGNWRCKFKYLFLYANKFLFTKLIVVDTLIRDRFFCFTRILGMTVLHRSLFLFCSYRITAVLLSRSINLQNFFKIILQYAIVSLFAKSKCKTFDSTEIYKQLRRNRKIWEKKTLNNMTARSIFFFF